MRTFPFRRVLAVAVAAALLLTAPGLPCYQAMAADMAGIGEDAAAGADGAAVAPPQVQTGAPAAVNVAAAVGIGGAGSRLNLPLQPETPQSAALGSDSGAAPVSPGLESQASGGELSSASAALPARISVPAANGVAFTPRSGAVRGAIARLRRYFGSRQDGAAEVAVPEKPETAAATAEASSPKESVSRTTRPQAPATGPPQVPVPSPAPAAHARSVWWFLGGMVVAQFGIEALAIAMPLLMKERFGGFSAMAQLAVYTSVASMFGRFAGGAVSDHRLKLLYVGSAVMRAGAISALILFLLGPGLWTTAAAATGLPLLAGVAPHLAGFYALKPLAVLIGLNSLNYFMRGIASTAEMTLPQVLLGQQQAVLERFNALEQWTIETVGVTGPKLGGWIVRAEGFVPALLLFPVSFAAAIAMFAFGIRLPAAPAPRPAEAASQPVVSVAAPAPGVFTRIARGARTVLGDPLMRTAFLSYVAYMLLNPLLYSIVGPAYGVLVSGGSTAAADVASYITALYSLGGLLGGLFLWRESTLVHHAKEGSRAASRGALKLLDGFVLKAYLGKWLDAHAVGGALDAAGEAAILRKSTLLWMKLGAAGLGAFAALLLRWPLPAYALMVPFGVAQVICTLKLRAIVMSEAPASEKAGVNGFFGAAAVGISALVLSQLGKLFDHFTGATPFLYFDAGLAALALACLWLRGALRRDMSAPKRPEASKK